MTLQSILVLGIIKWATFLVSGFVINSFCGCLLRSCRILHANFFRNNHENE